MDNELRNKIIMLSDMLIDDYHLEAGMAIVLDAQIGDREIKISILLKEDNGNGHEL